MNTDNKHLSHTKFLKHLDKKLHSYLELPYLWIDCFELYG